MEQYGIYRYKDGRIFIVVRRLMAFKMTEKEILATPSTFYLLEVNKGKVHEFEAAKCYKWLSAGDLQKIERVRE
jgi:hypothetical protein